jgi:hypothetical protein
LKGDFPGLLLVPEQERGEHEQVVAPAVPGVAALALVVGVAKLLVEGAGGPDTPVGQADGEQAGVAGGLVG